MKLRPASCPNEFVHMYGCYRPQCKSMSIKSFMYVRIFESITYCNFSSEIQTLLSEYRNRSDSEVVSSSEGYGKMYIN